MSVAGRCSGFCETHGRGIAACLEDGTAVACSPASALRGRARELERENDTLRAANRRLQAKGTELDRDKLVVTLRDRIRQLEAATRDLDQVRDAAVRALKRVARLK